MNLYRQGDVLLKQMARLPVGAILVDNTDRIVLAYGEATGHAHTVNAAAAEEFMLAEATGVVRRFLKVVGDATVTHEEHTAIPLPPGVYEIVQQREYSPEAICRVVD